MQWNLICGKYTKEVIGLVDQKGDKGDAGEKGLCYIYSGK